MIYTDYTFERATIDDLGQIALIFSKCFGVAVTENFFRWKYFKNPSGEAFCFVAKHKTGIVGAYAMIPENFSIFGKVKKIYKGSDLMVLPKHRSWGMANNLISGLMRCISDSTPLFLYAIASKFTAPLVLKNGWRKVDTMCRYFKTTALVNTNLILKSTKLFYRDGVLKEISSCGELSAIRSLKNDASVIKIIRSPEYLHWRLGDPRHIYQITGYFQNGLLLGSIICNTGMGDADYLLDLDVVSEDNKIAVALLNAAYYQSIKSGRKMLVAITNQNSTLSRHLMRGGFLKNPFRFGPLADEIGLYASIDDSYGKECWSKDRWDIYPDSYESI